ncbi:MAG: S8 family serine peptidase, partial [Verrucomicrobiota bacterium]
MAGVWDGGEVLISHQEFSGRVTDKDGVDSHYHATHVGGTIGASGIQSSAKGMAPEVLIDSYDWNDDDSEMANAAASAPGQTNLYLSNHSYGYTVDEEYWFGRYPSFVATVDDVVYDSQYYLPFWAAGNEQGEVSGGYDTLSTKGVAKNVITVGAVYDAVSGSSRYLPNANMISFSSWGPADDGRIKPDIVANGYSLYSCGDGNDSDYRTLSGTSMATPNACGSAALLVDYYDDLFPGQAMRASTLKGLIIHTADDLGNPGPDYKFGWGLMNTLAAAELLTDRVANSTRLTEATVTVSQRSDTYTFFSDGSEPVRVTLCWTDPEGSAQTTDND